MSCPVGDLCSRFSRDEAHMILVCKQRMYRGLKRLYKNGMCRNQRCYSVNVISDSTTEVPTFSKNGARVK